ncbi:MAG: UDP-glucose--hexose-1-phosphate uridylyltransferase [Proteobacteria bacterium]|nr:UDP-glucose--hexose-1-phosphate uridylyltransferase [Pseudomonadota bacterium]
MRFADQSHARRNLLTGEWVLVSPQRLLRPWQGQVDDVETKKLPAYDAGCYLCPGNERANGNRNPEYQGAFAFDNDYAAVTDVSDIDPQNHPLFEARPETGCCRVLCYTERHDLRLATMDNDQVCMALSAMIAEFSELDSRDDIAYVQVFENRGSMMGCSNPHPHAQIWATSNLPNEPNKEHQAQLAYWQKNGNVLLDDYLQAELKDGSRVVVAGGHFVAVVPYWAVWPFETLIVPRRVVAGPDELGAEEVASLAEVLRQVLAGYETLFDAAVPYSLGLHPRPSDGQAHPEWQFHIHVYPPLLRSATIRKYLVGFEMFGMPQRDLTPEVAAEKLREAHQNKRHSKDD